MENLYTAVLEANFGLFPGGSEQDHPQRDRDLLMTVIHPTEQPVFLHCLKITFISLLGQSSSPTTSNVTSKPSGDSYQLLVAVVGSVTVTCVTIMLALLALFFIRKTLLNRRRTFTYQSGSVRTHQLHFSFRIRSVTVFENLTLIYFCLLWCLKLFISPG